VGGLTWVEKESEPEEPPPAPRAPPKKQAQYRQTRPAPSDAMLDGGPNPLGAIAGLITAPARRDW
jgi:hypothetical protein